MESSKLQASLGKLIFKYRVEDLKGNKITLFKSTLRYLCLIIFVLIDIVFEMTGFNIIDFFTNDIENDKNQRVHDIITKTIVLKQSF